jgi:hypothetical protein
LEDIDLDGNIVLKDILKKREYYQVLLDTVMNLGVP